MKNIKKKVSIRKGTAQEKTLINSKPKDLTTLNVKNTNVIAFKTIIDEEQKKETHFLKVCSNCEKKYTTTNKENKTCSDECQQANQIRGGEKYIYQPKNSEIKSDFNFLLYAKRKARTNEEQPIIDLSTAHKYITDLLPNSEFIYIELDLNKIINSDPCTMIARCLILKDMTRKNSKEMYIYFIVKNEFYSYEDFLNEKINELLDSEDGEYIRKELNINELSFNPEVNFQNFTFYINENLILTAIDEKRNYVKFNELKEQINYNNALPYLNKQSIEFNQAMKKQSFEYNQIVNKAIAKLPTI